VKRSTRRLSPRVRCLCGILTLALLVPLAGATAASADPISDKKSQASQLAQELQARGDRESMLAEQVDRARLAADQVNAKLAKAQADMAAVDTQAAGVRTALRDQAASSYIHTGQQALSSMKPGFDPSVQKAYVESLTAGQNDALDQMRSMHAQLTEQQAQLKAAQKTASDALAKVQSAQRAAARATADEAAVLGQVKGDLAGLVAAEQASQEAAAAAKAQTALAARAPRSAASRSSSPAANAAPAAPAAETAVSPGASGAVEEARRQIGKPYSYGGSGPGSFDCSGLTAWAWGHAGHSLPHSSQAQYSSLPHVSLSALQPGDLVFFGSDIHHVGIYVGGGTMIEAPHTGLNVRYASIYRSDLVGAARP